MLEILTCGRCFQKLLHLRHVKYWLSILTIDNNETIGAWLQASDLLILYFQWWHIHIYVATNYAGNILTSEVLNIHYVKFETTRFKAECIFNAVELSIFTPGSTRIILLKIKFILASVWLQGWPFWPLSSMPLKRPRWCCLGQTVLMLGIPFSKSAPVQNWFRFPPWSGMRVF